MKTSVVIPNWNGEKLLKKNLPHVLKIGAGEVIVVDDASTDESAEELKSQNSELLRSAKLKSTGQKLKVIQNKKNLGFAKSVNRGVEAATGEVMVLLNTDVKPQDGLLDAVLPHFKNKKVFGVSFSEPQWSWSRGLWKGGFLEHEPGPLTNTTHDTFWVSGGSGAFRKSIWDRLGGFDEVFAPFYWEDIDISYRAAKRGYKLLWEPRARVIHEHEGTISKYFTEDYISFIQERNQLLFIWKNITSERMFKEHLNGLVKRLINSPGYIKVIAATLSKIPSIKKSRIKELKEVEITDEEIFSRFHV